MVVVVCVYILVSYTLGSSTEGVPRNAPSLNWDPWQQECASLRTSEEPALISWLWEGVPPGLLTPLQASQAMMKEEASIDLKAG